MYDNIEIRKILRDAHQSKIKFVDTWSEKTCLSWYWYCCRMINVDNDQRNICEINQMMNSFDDSDDVYNF